MKTYTLLLITMWTISPQLTRKTSNRHACTNTRAITLSFPLTERPFSSALTVYISSLFNLHRIEKRSTPQHPLPSSLPATTPHVALTVWGWKPIRLLSSTHERIPVKAPTEENGPCPLIYRLSQEEGPLMHFELTSSVQRPISLLFFSIQFFSI